MTAQEIQQQIDEARQAYEANDLTLEELEEILEDIKRTSDIDSLSDDMETKAKILIALDIASYLV